MSFYPRIPVQYSPNIKRLIPYLTHYQCLFLKRTKEFFQDCFEHSISEGTLVNHTNSFSAQLQPFLQEVKDKILQSPVVHFDETGMRVANKTQWLHTASTPEVTLQHIHKKRGKEAMDADEILPKVEQKNLVTIYQSILKEKQMLSSEPKKKGKQTPSQNLWNRFVKYDDRILAFLEHPDIPFDNNQAERDIRMTKVK
ncbi:transposase [Bacillus paralicheniformis]|uniref:IS66 family transposase n=1 Tax=Bacillus anthracis TaxID=1392 RepID=UPI001E4CB0C8|nr:MULTISPECIES: transposase [Bacillus cereus group]MEB9631528.1 transposase [Bacillus anthracis]